MSRIDRRAYAEMYGPTTGDRVRLGDTELLIQVEKDFTTYGDEVKFGGGKVIRDGMGQSQRNDVEVADVVITNALILDHWGVVKADIGIKTDASVGLVKPVILMCRIMSRSSLGQALKRSQVKARLLRPVVSILTSTLFAHSRLKKHLAQV